MFLPSLSAFNRLRSSIISLTMVSDNTNKNGIKVENLLVDDIPGINCRTLMTRKNMFAYFENCSFPNFGKNVPTEYFVVDT